MKTVWLLLKGEINRLFKYKILWFGIAVSMIWVLVLALSNKAEATALMPLLLVTDTGLMSIILLASSFYYEKQEGSIKTLFVAPISLTQLLTAKVISSLLSGIISMVLIGLGMLIVHGVFINYALALIYVILSTLAHVALGFVLVFYSPDFMSFLMKYMGLAIFLMVPMLLVLTDVIPADLEILALLSPTYATKFLVESLFVAKDWWVILFGVFDMVIIPGLLYPLVIYPKFKQYAVKG